MVAAVQFLPFSIVAVFGMIIYGSLYGLVPPKYVISAGEVLAVVGVLLFSRNTTTSSYWQFTFSGEIIMAVGLSGYFVNYLNVAISSAPAEMQGLIAGILQTVAQLGTAMGFAIASSQISTTGTPQELLSDYRNSFYTAMTFGGLAFILAILLIKPLKTVEKEVREGSDVDIESVGSRAKSDVDVESVQEKE